MQTISNQIIIIITVFLHTMATIQFRCYGNYKFVYNKEMDL